LHDERIRHHALGMQLRAVQSRNRDLAEQAREFWANATPEQRIAHSQAVARAQAKLRAARAHGP
jgi:hypothetical protein